MAKTDIKTVAKKNIKTIETVGIITEKVKDAGIKTKDDIGKAIHTDADTPEQYAAGRFQDTTHSAVTDAAYYFNKAGKKSVADTKKNIENAQVTLEDIKARRAERKAKSKINEQTAQSVMKTAENTPKKPSDTAMKNAPKTAGNDIRMGNNSAVKNKGRTIKTANDAYTKAKDIKTAKNTITTNRLAVSKTAEKSRKAAQYMRETAREAAKTAKNGFKVLMKVIKGAIKAAESLVSAIIAGGWVSVVIIILICRVGALCSSFYGIFFSSETSQSGMNITSVIQQINNEFDEKIDEIKSSGSFDGVEVIGSRSNWKDILSIYAVKTTTDENNPMEIATVNENKKAILSSIFWDMNNISKSVETRTETITKESTDKQGNKVETTEQVEKKYLVITLTGKSAEDMSISYSFNDTQKKYLAELMSDKNNKLWASLIYNIGGISGSGSIDIKDLDFSNETVNDTQKKIVAVATNSAKYGISARSGYCQAWVADVYQAVTGSRGSAHCALCAADMWAVSSDFSQIPVGATVYGYSSSQYGHVGIYIGNGMVAHNIGEIKIQSLESWIKTYKGFAWGFENGKRLV